MTSALILPPILVQKYLIESTMKLHTFVCVVAYMMLKIATPVGCSLGLLHMFKCAFESVERVNN